MGLRLIILTMGLIMHVPNFMLVPQIAQSFHQSTPLEEEGDSDIEIDKCLFLLLLERYVVFMLC